jgi:PAS domain-containing protein
MGRVWAALLLIGCTSGPEPPRPDPSDLEPADEEAKADGVPARFNRNAILDDQLFADDRLDAAAVQEFLEHTPYGTRSWLASETLWDRPASTAIVEIAQAHRLNPLLLLVRLQVESSLINRETHPGAAADYALGCGCPNECSSAFRGLGPQLDCAAVTLRTLYEASADGTGVWRAGHRRVSLDGLSVTPVDDATAALYAYTPWVLEGRGGNWLVWNVTRRYLVHLQAEGLLPPP